ncbi:PrgI family protein [Clostridium felsineum]|uniref:PrgI family protein n=1 Tax=Clostridium felsineum TaxID=36839 RepID=UPI00214D52CB|nr:PrgI family protein [Clostridium felsineum]MCR3759359.1 PrgI family protein [Clostridium felsineum]
MRYFKVPFNINEEDKIIGGYISLRQFSWIILSVFLSALLFLANRSYMTVTRVIGHSPNITMHPINLTIRLVVAFLIVIFSALCAFYKVEDTYNFDKYLIKMIKFKMRNKTFKFRK